MYGIGYGGNKYRPRGLFGGGGNAGASTAQVPIVQGTPRTREQAQAMGLIGGSAPRSRGYFDELLADPFTTLFLGTNGLDRKYASQQAEQEAARMAPQRAWMENYVSGLPDNQRFAAMTNPEEYSKNTAQGFAPQTSTFYDPTSGKWNQKPQDMMTVGNDATVFDPNTRAPVYSNRAPQGPKLFNTGQAVVSVSPDNKAQVLYRDPQSQSGNGDTYRPATPADLQQWGIPPGTAVKINNRTNEPQVISGAKPASEYTPTQQNKFIQQAQTLDAVDGALKAYIDLLDDPDIGPQLWTTGIGGDNAKAKKLDAARTAILIQAKELFNLGVLNGPDLDIISAAIPDVTGWEAMGKSPDSAKAQLNVLSDYIARGRNQIPSELLARARPNQEPPQQGGGVFGAGAGLMSAAGARPPAQRQPAAMNIPPQAIQELMSDPSPAAIAEFNDAFGAGAAEAVLNGR